MPSAVRTKSTRRESVKALPRAALFPWPRAVALFLLTVILYIPSMSNGFIWDDPQYVVDNPTLKTADGIWSIWTDPTSLPQYYPLVHTTFWVEARLWGTSVAAGYHVDNILLHALAAVLLWRALLVLKIPLPWLAAAVFAVHPVMVESVTWVTERKNVLSLVFYLLAFHAYVRTGFLDDIPEPAGADPRPHSRRWYSAALLFFLFALFSKTVTCSLPAAILLVVWWKRGRITWRDIRPLVPMFVVGLILSSITSHLEHTFVGARGPDFEWSAVDRLLIAGHAVCFYALKLVWPYPLMFMYPRWDLHADRTAQFAYPAVAAVVVIGFWIARRWVGRGPLVAVLFFVGTLVPALGFVNVYPMRYSFVADHFQYLASIGVIVLCVVCLHRLVVVVKIPPAVRQGLAAVILLPLAGLTWRQQHIYKDAKTLWLDTIRQNETCWMAHVNLASAYKAEKQLDAALLQTKRAMELAPHEADTNYDYGIALALRARWPEAIAQFRRAIACDPQCAPAWSDLARTLWEHGGNTPAAQTEALAAAQTALAIQPHMADAHYVLARVAEYQQNFPAAIAEYNQVLIANADDFHAHYNLGNCLLATNRPGEAAGEYQQVLKHDPQDAPAWTNLGAAFLKVGRVDEAAACFRNALQINPNLRQARENLNAIRQRSAS